jgi:hypothetical protein
VVKARRREEMKVKWGRENQGTHKAMTGNRPIQGRCWRPWKAAWITEILLLY